MSEVLNKEDVRLLIESDKNAAIEILAEHEAKAKLHRNHKTWKFCWDLAHGIDPESIQQQKEAVAAANAVSPEVLQERKKIEASDAWKNHLHKDHAKAHKTWLKTFNS